MLLSAARGGLISECGFETLDGLDALAITCCEEKDGETTEQRLWFDPPPVPSCAARSRSAVIR
jgi:hypothetical protein